MYCSFSLIVGSKADVFKFNPVDLALQLLDSNASGKDPESFSQTKLMLSRALKGSVDSTFSHSSEFRTAGLR